MRVALVLIYPCGKARNSPPGGALKEGRQTYEMAVRQWARIPFPLALDYFGSVLAVKGVLRRFAPWNRSGPIRRGWLFTREKGG